MVRARACPHRGAKASVNTRQEYRRFRVFQLDGVINQKPTSKTTPRKIPPAHGRGQVYREASRLGDAGTRGPFPTARAGTLAEHPPYSVKTIYSGFVCRATAKFPDAAMLVAHAHPAHRTAWIICDETAPRRHSA